MCNGIKYRNSLEVSNYVFLIMTEDVRKSMLDIAVSGEFAFKFRRRHNIYYKDVSLWRVMTELNTSELFRDSIYLVFN